MGVSPPNELVFTEALRAARAPFFEFRFVVKKHILVFAIANHHVRESLFGRMVNTLFFACKTTTNNIGGVPPHVVVVGVCFCPDPG